LEWFARNTKNSIDKEIQTGKDPCDDNQQKTNDKKTNKLRVHLNPINSLISANNTPSLPGQSSPIVIT